VSRLRRVAKVFVGLLVVLLILVGIGIAAVETGWAKNQIRQLIVHQANQYLTATLDIGTLGGSLVRGLELGDVRLSRNGQPLIAIDAIALTYSIRELLQPGVVIRRVRLVRPRIVGAKQPDGRWDLAALIKRERREQARSGPGRPIEVQAIEIVDGHITLHSPLDFGAAHVPTDFSSLNASLAFAYYPVRWQLTFNRISWIGRNPELSMNALTGVFGRGPTGWFFNTFHVVTPRSDFTMRGTINTEVDPTAFDLQVTADRFAFQEWSGVLGGLRNIAVEAAFDTSLKGTPRALGTDLELSGTGGAIRGRLTLDTTVPGWHGAGTVDVERLELGHWLNRKDRPSDITGRVTFDLALGFGRHFPRGTYSFDGAHAMYMDYAADDLRASGRITDRDVLIARATAVSYGANVTLTSGSIGIDDPFRYRFAGTATHVDLREVPANVPVPHVESTLAFDYDVHGRFSHAFIAGTAAFATSQFLGATIGPGTVGSIDSSQTPVHYTGDGDISGIDMRRFGEGLDVGWMRDPRYAGTISGHFRVDGSGSDRQTLALTASGRLARAHLFSGDLTDADVSMTIERGTLQASYNGAINGIDPAIPFADPRFAASLTGIGHLTATVASLLTAERLTLTDYDVAGSLQLQRSKVREVDVDRGVMEATLQHGTLSIARLDVSGPAVEGQGSGSITFTEPTASDFSYNATRLDLAQLKAVTGRDASGIVAAKGRATGPFSGLHLTGDASASDLNAFDVQALTLIGSYDFTIGGDEGAPTSGQVNAEGSFLTLFGSAFREASGTATYDAPTLRFDLNLSQTETRKGRIAGTVAVTQPRADTTQLAVSDLTVTFGANPWRLVAGGAPPTVTWSTDAVDITPMAFITAAGGEGRLGISGSWRANGTGALHATASHVFLESLQGEAPRPARFGGLLDADATIRGTRAHPIVGGTATITDGRVERVSFQQLIARVDYTDRVATIDARLDQAPGVSLTAVGTIPQALVDGSAPDGPIDVTVRSTSVSLGLIEGVTTVVRNVTGDGRFDVHVVGTGRDPHFEGSVSFANASFLVSASGSRYKNASAAIQLARDRISVESLHVEDNGGHALEVHGSLGTHELRVGELELDLTARHFEVIHNELGRVDIDAALGFRGRFEQPRVTGDLAIVGGEIRVDELLDRTIYQPYATTPTEVITTLDAVAALNPWERLFLDVSLQVPETLRLGGANVQISPGTPIGLGDINLRVGGDLSLYKGSGGPLSVTGSLDAVSGSYGFQGRRFIVDEAASSINFRGDLNPEVYVSVTRQVAGIETRVTIIGSMRQPELQLSSVPPLEASNILSLIVFNAPTNDLSPAQQQELVVRAGALAAGFLATPIVSAIQQEIGLQVLDIEPSGDIINAGPRITIGQEIAPGLVAQFSRQFGQEPYDEATIEYYLSRILRLRATFSDAQSLEARSPFRRVERAGIDLLLFFSF
jgi:autotransporter translocation and assembly factor TamB